MCTDLHSRALLEECLGSALGLQNCFHLGCPNPTVIADAWDEALRLHEAHKLLQLAEAGVLAVGHLVYYQCPLLPSPAPSCCMSTICADNTG